MTDVITGKEIKDWRKSAGLEQKVVALHMGVSPATLCRIEQEDRTITGEQLDRLRKLYADLRPDSPIGQSIPKEPPPQSSDNTRAILARIPDVQKLSAVWKTYQYNECTVVPSQYYAQWSKQEPKRVNEAIDRLSEQGRLEIEEDFFRLTYEEARNFVDVAKCDLDSQEVKKGLVLIARKAVNTLTHYFNDPHSKAKSIEINTQYSYLEQAFEKLTEEDMNDSRSQMLFMTQLCLRWVAMDKQRSATAAQIEAVSKNLSVTDGKVDATKAELEDHRQSSRLSSDQVEAIDNAIRFKIKEFGHGCVKGLIQRYLKKTFLGGRAASNTFKDIASRHFDEMLQRVQTWIPTPADRESISRHRIDDGLDPAPTAQVLLFPQQPLAAPSKEFPM